MNRYTIYIIYWCHYYRALESLKTEGRSSHLWEMISLAEVIKTLEDLIDYFAPPGDDLGLYSFGIQCIGIYIVTYGGILGLPSLDPELSFEVIDNYIPTCINLV